MSANSDSGLSVVSRRAFAFEGRRVALTGATGFIGHRLARALSAVPGLELRCLARSGSRKKLDALDSVQVVEGDLEDRSALETLLRDVDYVFHLAGLTRARNRAEFDRINAESVGRLAATARAVCPKLERFIYTSSLAAAGPTEAGGEARDEAAVEAPVSLYGRSKLAGEQALRAEIGDLPWSVARPPAVYGPGERDLFEMFKMVSKGVAPRLGFRDQELSFVYADDLVEGLLAIATSKNAVGETYFVAHPEIRTDLHLLESIEAALGKTAWKPRIPFIAAHVPAAFSSLGEAFGRSPGLINRDRLRELGPSRWVCRVDKLREEVGFVCPTPLAVGVPLTAAWYRKSGWL